ncbi:DUF2171 domain-containing protein [Paraburkholderia bannensis]|uniref:DUF2171 domain-containing protein n=1 Tax=Paraburkholderia bannensis TaxID=765414 RepID=UPI002AB5EB5F|nr:DUF2171 domain-containing protein [Paraburkholderia bannensis]
MFPLDGFPFDLSCEMRERQTGYRVAESVHWTSMEVAMSGNADVRESMEVVGADGVFIGTVDSVEGNRIKLVRGDGFGKHKKHHHYIDMSLVAGVEGEKVRLSLSADAAIALVDDERSGGGPG